MKNCYLVILRGIKDTEYYIFSEEDYKEMGDASDYCEYLYKKAEECDKEGKDLPYKMFFYVKDVMNYCKRNDIQIIDELEGHLY